MATYDRIIEQAEERLRAKDSVQAMQLYAEAAKIAPDRKEPLIELALLFIAHDDVEGAAGFLEKALALDGTDAFIRLNLALAYYEIDRAEDALRHLKEAVLLIQYIVASARIDEMFGNATDADLERAEELETTGEYAIELLKEMAGITEPQTPVREFKVGALRLAS